MKNRYCRNTKLTEWEFEWILIEYCSGTTATETARRIAEWVSPVSRQTVARLYQALGNYLYEKYERSVYVKVVERLWGIDRLEAFEDIMHEMIWRNLQGTLDYALIRKHKWWHYADPDIRRLLKHRWDAFNGFPRKKLKVHMGWVSFILAEGEGHPLDTLTAHFKLLAMLEKNPL